MLYFQAGCGACIVTARVPNPVSGESVIKSVNSVRKVTMGTKLTLL